MALQCLRILPVPVAAERADGCAAFVPSRGWDGRATAGCLSPVAGSHMSLIGVVVIIITGVVRWQLRVCPRAWARRAICPKAGGRSPRGVRSSVAPVPGLGGVRGPPVLVLVPAAH